MVNEIFEAYLASAARESIQDSAWIESSTKELGVAIGSKNYDYKTRKNARAIRIENKTRNLTIPIYTSIIHHAKYQVK